MERSNDENPLFVNDEGAAQALAMIDDADTPVAISLDPNCKPAPVRHKARYVDQTDTFAASADMRI
jgi:fructokinase